MRKIWVLDTTLRDGEQSPGVSLTSTEKVEIALQLQKLGVDRIETGFPATSPGEISSMQEIAKHVTRATLVGSLWTQVFQQGGIFGGGCQSYRAGLYL